jgi:hypothetical protein
MKLLLKALPIAALLACGTAFADDTCNNVTIKMSNRTTNEIKLTKFEYYDYDDNKWRTENLFGVDGEQKVEPSFAFSPKRDLGHIGNDKTKFRVSWKRHAGGSDWDPGPTVTTADFTCSDSMTKSIDITG